MRTLSDTLKAAQQDGAINTLVKLVLTHNSTTYTYTKSRILDVKETGDGSLQSIVIVLNNNDKVLTDIDLKGYKGVLSNGANTVAGEEYSALAPMWVLAQEFDSDPNKLTCTLSLVGICNLMSQDEASEAYQPDDTDNKTVKTLVNQIAGATLDCFSLCKAYEVVWDPGYDSLADSYKPKDNFRIYVGNNRNSAIDRLLAYTKNVKVVKADGKIHIFKPTTSGSTYDSEYSLDSGQHQFFSKALRNRYVTPNYIKVESRDDDDPKYSGTAQDDSYATLPDELKKHHYKQTYLESNDQATEIAEAILAKAQMWCEAGAANAPMNVGTEVFDYVKVTDSREADYRVGNIGKYVRHYDVRKNEWRIAFNFGNWQNVRKVLANLNITPDDIENYFSRLSVGDLYAEHILADNMDFVWIDPDNTIDLSKIGDNLDNLADGEYYYRARKMHLDGETGLTLWEGMRYYIRFSTDSDEAGIRRQDSAPSGVEAGEYWIDTSGEEPIIKRWTGSTWFTIEQWEIDALNEGVLTAHSKLTSLSVDGLILLDKVEIGDDYDLVYKSSISAHQILLSKTTKDGAWYQESGVGINADVGIGIYGGEGLMGLRTYPTLQDYLDGTNVQCYVGTDGRLYAGGGKVSLDSNGILIDNSDDYTNRLALKYNENSAEIFFLGLTLGLYVPSNCYMGFWVGASARIYIDHDTFYPNNDNTMSIGKSNKQFYGGYFKSRLKIPVGVDMYD